MAEFNVDATRVYVAGLSAGRHGRDHERHLSRALRRDGHSFGPRSWVRHRRGFSIRRHAKRTEFSGIGGKEDSSQGCE